jgi:DNA invertase Pin-like site-specific DNA recombinase
LVKLGQPVPESNLSLDENKACPEKKRMNDSLIYLGYVRKSSEDNERQAQSIGTQTAILTDYAIKNGLNLIEILKESKSAKVDGNRPIFTQLLARLVRGEANAIFVAHIDRLARNGIEAGQLVKLFEAGIIKEIKTPSKIYDTIQDLLPLEIEFTFASEFSRRLSVRVREGNQAKLNRGEYLSFAPLGYKNKNGKIYSDKKTSPLIISLFTEYASGGYSLSSITHFIQSLGLLSRHAKSLGLKNYDNFVKYYSSLKKY